MSILRKQKGTFIFLDKDNVMHRFTDYSEVKDVGQYMTVVCFLPDIPPPPHTVQQHEDMMFWNEELQRILEVINGG